MTKKMCICNGNGRINDHMRNQLNSERSCTFMQWIFVSTPSITCVYYTRDMCTRDNERASVEKFALKSTCRRLTRTTEKTCMCVCVSTKLIDILFFANEIVRTGKKGRTKDPSCSFRFPWEFQLVKYARIYRQICGNSHEPSDIC